MTVADIEFVPLKHTEDDSFRCVGYHEPYVRRQDVIFYSQNSKWNIKVTFNSVALKEFHENSWKYSQIEAYIWINYGAKLA